MKLSNILRYHLLPGSQIIQFGPVRTGSTLVYNLLRECLPRKNIDKSHTYSKHYRKLPLVVTVRHPMDCIASLMLLKGGDFDDVSLCQAVEELTLFGGGDYALLESHSRCLFLRYEDFFSNYEIIFDAFEDFFHIKVPVLCRAEITSRYSLESMEMIAAHQDGFSNWDKVTKVHGNHVSIFRGHPFYHRNFFTRAQLDLLTSLCEKLLTTWGYDK